MRDLRKKTANLHIRIFFRLQTPVDLQEQLLSIQDRRV